MLASSLQEQLAGPFIPQTTPKFADNPWTITLFKKNIDFPVFVKGQLTTYIISVWGCQKPGTTCKGK